MAESAAHGVEKYQVAWFQVFLLDGFSGCSLLVCTARQHKANGLAVYLAHQAAAVKAGFCTVAAAPVRNAQKTHGGQHQV